MRIEERLGSAASAVDRQIDTIPVRPVGALRRRQRNQRVAAAVSTTTLFFALIAGSAFVFSDTADSPVVTTPNEVVPPVASQIVESNLEWDVVDATVFDLSHAYSWEETIYALSTAPGKIDPVAYEDPGFHPPQAMYSTTDGRSWDTQLVPADLWLADLDHHEGVAYAVGSAPGFANTSSDPVKVNVARTADGGMTWDSEGLPVIAAPPAKIGSVRYRAMGAKIAAGPNGVVAAVNTKFGMDYSAYVPEEYRNQRYFVNARPEGLVVHDFDLFNELEGFCHEAWEANELPVEPEACALGPDGIPDSVVVHRVAWTELEIAGPPVTAYQELFVSSDGTEFEAVTSPFVGGELISMVATGDGFVGLESVYTSRGGTETAIWYSADGSEWEQRTTPSTLGGARSMEKLGDRLGLVGWSNDLDHQGAVVYVSDDNAATWRVLDVASLSNGESASRSEWVSVPSIGSDSAAMVVAWDGRSGFGSAAITTDLVQWSEVDVAGLLNNQPNITVHSVFAEGDRVLMSIASSNSSEPAKLQTLVGTER